MCSTQYCIQKSKKLNVLRNAIGEIYSEIQHISAGSIFKGKPNFQNIKSRPFICSSQSLQDNYFRPFTSKNIE